MRWSERRIAVRSTIEMTSTLPLRAMRIDSFVSRLSHRYPARLGRLSRVFPRLGILVRRRSSCSR
jgi:hypothetical protein